MSEFYCTHGTLFSTCLICNNPGNIAQEIQTKEFTFPGISDFINISSEKLKMLFVDDRTKRIHYALEEYGKTYDVTIATCVPEALRQLCAQDWAIVSLDHDLNGYDFQDPDSPTCGMEIVRYIEKCGWPVERNKPDFWVHTSNLFAAHLMVVRLTEVGFNTWHKPIRYKVEHMKYDEKGIPI